MTGRLFSVLALVGGIASLVLVATLASASEPKEGVSAPRVTQAAWTQFRVRPVTVLAAGGLVEAEVGPAGSAVVRLPHRSIYRFIRSQNLVDSRLALANGGD
jgi:hypothetical protein